MCCFVSIVVLCVNSGSKWLKPAKNKFTLMWFREFFSSKFQQIHINVRFRPFISFTSLCQTVAGISMISQFHEFLSQIFGGFLKFDLTVRVGEGRGFNKRGWVWHAHGVHATPKGYVLEGRRLLLPWVNKRFTVVEDR